MRKTPDNGAPWARFDDVTTGRALHFEKVTRTLIARDPCEVLDVLRAAEHATQQGSWAFGYVAYEAAAGLHPALPVHESVEDLPLAWFAICAPPDVVPVIGPTVGGRYRADPWTCDWDAEQHAGAVQLVREFIAAGETYQANVTTRMRTTVHGDLRALYADLALGQRSAHNALLDMGRFVTVGASPELFFEIRDGRVHMRPMKGTAPRGRTTAEDAVLLERLRNSPKERAENIMIVDLVRNDLARVARTGSVEVEVLLRPERYESVHHLTSDVAADLHPDADLASVFAALFPCGSVTGAPKARTMEIIRHVEPGPRGVYSGAVGFLGPPGAGVRARFHVAIRTALVDRRTGAATYGTGGGITWDSQPAAEYAELLTKARVLDARPRDFHLIETMRHETARGLLSLDAHLSRMSTSAGYFGFSFDPGAARAVLEDRLAGAGDARVRLLAYRNGTVSVDIGPLPEPDDKPVLLVVDDDPIDSRTCWPHHKTSLRSPYTSRRNRHREADDVVLVNERGELTETTTANLAVHLDGTWWTPPQGDGCLPGVKRAELLQRGTLEERVLRPDVLNRATGVAVVNALRGWRAATLVPDPTTVNANTVPIPGVPLGFRAR